MKEEITRILKMVKEGKLTAEQAAELIGALGAGRTGDAPPRTDGEAEGKRPSFVSIHVTDGKGERIRVRIPFGLVSCVEKFVPKGIMAMKVGKGDFDLEEFLRNATCGEMISVDADDGTRVRIECD